MQAAILAALTADRDTRTMAIGALRAIARSPDPAVAPFLAADAGRESALHDRRPTEAAAVLGRRAAHLMTMIVRFDGNVRGLRQDLARQAPRYARALKEGVMPGMDPFTKLDPDALVQLTAFLKAQAARPSAAALGSLR